MAEVSIPVLVSPGKAKRKETSASGEKCGWFLQRNLKKSQQTLSRKNTKDIHEDFLGKTCTVLSYPLGINYDHLPVGLIAHYLVELD